MYSEIIKNKFSLDSNWGNIQEGINDFKEKETSEIDDINFPWDYIIPLNELDIKIEKVDLPIFTYRDRTFTTCIRKIPVKRLSNLTENFSNIQEPSLKAEIKNLLENFINENFTHVYSIMEKREPFYLSNRRVMDSLYYICRGTKIIY